MGSTADVAGVTASAQNVGLRRHFDASQELARLTMLASGAHEQWPSEEPEAAETTEPIEPPSEPFYPPKTPGSMMSDEIPKKFQSNFADIMRSIIKDDLATLRSALAERDVAVTRVSLLSESPGWGVRAGKCGADIRYDGGLRFGARGCGHARQYAAAHCRCQRLVTPGCTPVRVSACGRASTSCVHARLWVK